MQFDVGGARKEGYSDAEIAVFLSDRASFDLDGARKEGYEDAEIVGFLLKHGTRAPEPSAGELAVAERPARMTLTRGGQPQLEAEATQTDTGPGPDAIPDLLGQWANLLKPAGAAPQPDRRYAAANEAGRQMIERQNRSGTAAELAQFAQADAANALASTDFWRGVGASLQSVPADWKQIFGGAMRLAGEALPEEQPGRTFTESWNAAKREMAAIGADFYEQGSREVEEAHRGLKPEFGAQAVGSAVRSLGTMLPVLATGGLTGSPAVVIGMMAGETGAKSYGEARDQGLEPGQAAIYALLQATIEGGTEYLPIKALFRRDLSAGRQFLNFMVREVPSEEAATVLQSAVDKVSLRPDMTMRDLYNDMAVTAVSTPLAGAGQVGAVRAMRAAQADPSARSEAQTALTVAQINRAPSVDEAIAVALRSQAAAEERSAAEEAIASLPETAGETTLPQPQAVEPIAPPSITRVPSFAPGIAPGMPAAGSAIGLPTEVATDESIGGGLPEASELPTLPAPAAQEQRSVEGQASIGAPVEIAPQATESSPASVSGSAEDVLILGKPVADVSDALLRVAASRAASVEQRQAATEELSRRSAQVQPTIEAAPELEKVEGKIKTSAEASPKTAMQLAFERAEAALRERETTPAAEVQAISQEVAQAPPRVISEEAPRATDVMPYIRGVPAEDVPLRELEAMAKAGNAEIKVAAQTELRRREAMPVPEKSRSAETHAAGQQRLFVERGNQRFEVASLEEASRKWGQFREASNVGVAQAGNGARIVDQDGKDVARIAYNGRIFPPGEWKPGMKPIYEPGGKEFSHPSNEIESGTPVDSAAHEAATSPQNALPEPTEGQKDAGNYRKGHVRVGGLDISIENPQGSERSGADANGKPWSVVMKSHYGYALESVGYDKDHVDTFVRPGTPEDWRGTVFVVNQAKANGHLDEHKAMLGWSSETEARAAYLENYEPGWEKRIRSIVPMPLEQFKAWATDKSKDGPTGGDAQPMRILDRLVDQLTSKALDIASRKARTPAMRAAAQVELDRRAETHGVRQAAAEADPLLLTAKNSDAANPANESAPILIFGKPPEQLAQRTLEFVAKAGNPALKAAARAEIERRAQAVGSSSTQLAPQPSDLAEGDSGDQSEIPPTLPPREAENAPEVDETMERPAVGIALTPPYSGAAEGESVADTKGARPDVIRQAVRDLFRVPINEGGFKGSRDKLGIYKVKPQTIRVRNQNDIGVIAHETGHHFSETSRPVRELMKAHEGEIRNITPYAAGQKTAALQREEGFAEYLRLRWTQPARAKAKAPAFSAAFEQYVDDNGHRAAFDQIEGAINDWQNLPPAERILAKVGDERPDFRKRFNVDRIVFEVFDRWLPLKNMVADLKPDVAASADPFKLAHLLSGDSAIIEDWLLRETIPFDFKRRANVEDRGKSFADILKPIEDQEREFGAYLIAKRANELMKRGKEHLYSQDEIVAGLKLETPEFKKAAEEIYKYQDELLQYAVEGGLLSQYVADKFRQFPFYVPFFRVGDPIARRGDIFKQIRGGTENLKADPIALIIENTVRVIHATNRNFVLAKAHDLARTVPGGGRWLENVPMPERAVKLETQKIIEQLREQGIEIDTSTAEAIATTQTFFVKNPFGDERERIIVTKRSGKPRALQVNDDMLWHALERFEPVDMGVMETILSVPADILRAGIVLSPEFMARNFARDTLSGFIQSKKGLVPVVGTVNGFKEILTRSDAARLYRAFGGAYGDMWRADHGQERVLVERMARHGGFDPRTIVTPRGLLSLLMRLGSLTEAGTRVAEFKKTMQAGDIDSLIDAAYNAREVSVDFGMHGHSRTVRFLTRITPFMNPAMQGWYKAARTVKTQPLATVFRGGMMALASILLFLNNRDKDWYEEIERWEKNTYWHLDIGLRDPQGQVIPLRIPKPFEWGGFFGSIPEALAEVSIKQQGEKFAKRLASIVDDVFTFRVVPSAILLPVELWGNRNTFTGRPIVPESKERLAPELQATPGTSLTAKKAGALMDASPSKIDHAVRGLFGTLGTYSMMLADQAIMLSEDKPRPLPIPWQRAPVVRAFFHDPNGANSQQVTEFYDLLRDARRAEQSLKYLPPERMAEYFEKHRSEIEGARSAEKVSRMMARLRKDNEQIRENHDLPDAERMQIIAENNRAIRWLARDYMKDQEQDQERAAAGAR